MRLTSIVISTLCAVLCFTGAQYAFAHTIAEQNQTTASDLVNPDSVYIELINENEVMLHDKKLTLAELKEFIKDTQNDQPEKQIILYITDTQFVNHAYRFAFDMRHSIQKHIWVTYRP